MEEGGKDEKKGKEKWGGTVFNVLRLGDEKKS